MSRKVEESVYFELIINVLGSDFLKIKQLIFLESKDLLSNAKPEK